MMSAHDDLEYRAELVTDPRGTAVTLSMRRSGHEWQDVATYHPQTSTRAAGIAASWVRSVAGRTARLGVAQ